MNKNMEKLQAKINRIQRQKRTTVNISVSLTPQTLRYIYEKIVEGKFRNVSHAVEATIQYVMMLEINKRRIH